MGRGALVVGFLVLVYSMVPVDGFNDERAVAAWVRLVAVGLAFLLVLGVELRIVASSHAPMIRAAEAVVESVVAFVCLFALLHLSISTTDDQSFSEPLDRLDALYFTSGTLATVGFGDITPVDPLARTVVTVQMLAGLGVLVIVVKAAFHAASRSRRP